VLDNKDQDVRGWSVRDARGRVLGAVSELIVDTGSKRVSHVVLTDGSRLQAHDLIVGNGVLTVAEPERTVTEKAAAQKVVAEKPIVEKPVTEKPIVQKPIEKKPAPPPQPAPKAEVPVGRLATSALPEGADIVVPVIDEEVEIGKRRIDMGTVHVETHVVAENYDQDIVLREEHIQVERRRVDLPLDAADLDARMKDASVVVTAKSEYPVVEKHARIVEEIIVDRSVDEREVQLRDTVRHTEVDVTELPVATAPANVQGARA
jgi:stress response protein YsnF/sporulation protein YlmC with PRC-barrel domain